MATSAAQDPIRSDPWADSPHAVFLGFEIAWRKSLADYARHLDLAAKWEAVFQTWSVAGRTFELAKPEIGYFVRLSDGAAHFRCESSEAHRIADDHITQLMGSQGTRSRAMRARTQVEVQYLVPRTEEFPVLVNKLAAVLLRNEFAQSLEAKLQDFAYLADFRVGGRWHQVNIGAVRADEVWKRVAAVTLDVMPDVAVFCSVTGKAPLDEQPVSASLAIRAALDVGSAVLKEISQ